MIYFVALALLWTGFAVAQNEGDVRLEGKGSTWFQGRVEIYHNGKWGTVCKDMFTNADASAVCRQLGLQGAGATAVANTFGAGSNNIWLDNVVCSGTEMRLDHCQHNGWGINDCDHSEDIGVRCQVTASAQASVNVQPTTGSASATIGVQQINCSTADVNVRLVGPTNIAGTGVVQINRNGTWGGVCDDDWDINDAKVVCRSLCFNASYALSGMEECDLTNITEPMTVQSVDCAGNEKSILNCPQTNWNSSGGVCMDTEKASVTCELMLNAAPAPPDPNVNCTNGNIITSFSKVAYPSIQPSQLTLDVNYTGACNGGNPTETSVSVSISVPYDECGTNVTFNDTHIFYNTQIRYEPRTASGTVMQVSNAYLYKITCILPRDVNASRALEPEMQTVTKSNVDQFAVSLLFYSDKTFRVPVRANPFKITLGQYILAGLNLTDVDSDLKLVVHACFATPGGRRQSPQYKLFEDKCCIDNTTGFYPQTRLFWGFRFQSFIFLGHNEVHIHCDAIVCRKEETHDDCDRSCLSPAAASGRRRRSVRHHIIQVDSGAIIVNDPRPPGPVIIRGGISTTRGTVETTNIVAPTGASIFFSTKEPNVEQTSSNGRKVSTTSSVTEAEQQAPGPSYMNDIETIKIEDKSGADGNVPHSYVLYSVIVGYFCI